MFAGIFNRTAVMIVAGLCCTTSVWAQTSSPAPKKTVTTVRSNPASTSAESRTGAAQVVTIVHRINGLKMFRLLLRSEQQLGAIANFDEAFNLTDDVHTNIIAGLAMGDGRTIAAWLPDADVEFGPSFFSPIAPRPPAAPEAPSPQSTQPAQKARQLEAPGFPFRGGMFGSPDLTVIGPDGRRLAAEYIGLDGATGLSILRLSDSNLSVNSTTSDQILDEGENVRLFNPEPAASMRPNSAGSLYVRMGTTLGTILSIKRAPAGRGVARFKVKSPRLSLANIGGVAVNEAGETVGIVDAVEGPEATILPTALIRRAAKRVLAQHSSVPRPWLGVKGEPVSRLSIDQMKNQGWKLERAASLLQSHRGILLTSIAPGSPAASASLRAGDVILKVNNEVVRNADDFSWMLDQAGPSSSVVFTLARPDRLAEEAVNVELSGLSDPAWAFGFPSGSATPSLLSHGIETIALRPVVAARLGANSGLLVVYVDPSTAAFDAGLQPGDVIESIDGKPVTSANAQLSSISPAATRSFEIVRKKQKLVITVSAPEKKN